MACDLVIGSGSCCVLQGMIRIMYQNNGTEITYIPMVSTCYNFPWVTVHCSWISKIAHNKVRESVLCRPFVYGSSTTLLSSYSIVYRTYSLSVHPSLPFSGIVRPGAIAKASMGT